ncbi:hypothetical protein BJ742DRAFT_676777 [Cladochytrium replicatum]|nr:hypothetical protein BJ742DRAFT_676777 [Cladochytrium replicatum]
MKQYSHARFVPSYKFGFGLTYGNATRKILQTDSSLKQGRIQREIHRRQVNHTAEQTALASSGDAGGIGQDFNGEGDQLWKRGKKYATGDDRFSFPPVPGYTGYIPRSQEHFGKPFVETTNASLSDFQRMLRHKNELPPRVRAIKAQQRPVICAAGGTSKPVGNKATFAYSAECFPINEESPYHLPENHPQKTFISGYTGFVPRLQNHFGEPYSHSVRKAIDEFTAPGTAGDPYTGKRPETIVEKRIVRTHPIPGTFFNLEKCISKRSCTL